MKIIIEQGSHKESVSVKVRDLLDDRQSKRGGKIVEANTGGPGRTIGNSLFTTGKSTEGMVSLKTYLRPETVTFDKGTRLGSGTYSNVYDGLYLGSEVAVKRFKVADSASLKAYQKELEVFTWLRINGSHPNLI